jgi:hypothetical protein
VRSVLVVVLDVLGEDLLKVMAVEDEEPVQTLPRGCPHEPFRERVRPGPHWCLYDPGALCAEDLVEAGGELRVPVPDQEANPDGSLGRAAGSSCGLIALPTPPLVGRPAPASGRGLPAERVMRTLLLLLLAPVSRGLRPVAGRLGPRGW